MFITLVVRKNYDNDIVAEDIRPCRPVYDGACSLYRVA